MGETDVNLFDYGVKTGLGREELLATQLNISTSGYYEQ
jgi:hypothetical protein